MILDRFRLDGHVALVTGASRGIGRACAIALAEAGADVAIAARSVDTLQATAQIIDDLGRSVLPINADLSDTSGYGDLIDRVSEWRGRLDTLVNNVGGAMPRPFAATTPGFLERSFHFNVTTAFAMTQGCLPLLLESDNASVVNISSLVGRITNRGIVGYGTAKAALNHMTRLTAQDLAPRVRVNAIGVGSTATSALEVVLSNDDLRERMVAQTPMKRIGDATDIAAACLYLASPAASYITGTVLAVDGGCDGPNLDHGLPDLAPGDV
ncbi:MAG: SDR family oxidoreductase [Acidimicrobiia bacterium]|nr:SDR family oxidoreductase [Acidimicrobiia bacterium]MBP8179520.1 SDR family oxidoreductase [Acidimicrobiia bacterium]